MTKLDINSVTSSYFLRICVQIKEENEIGRIKELAGISSDSRRYLC